MPYGIKIPLEDDTVNSNITSTNVTIIVQNCRRYGNVVTFNCIIDTTALAGNPVIITLPWKADGRYDFLMSNQSGQHGALYFADGSNDIVLNNGSTPISAARYIITGTYITSE